MIQWLNETIRKHQKLSMIINHHQQPWTTINYQPLLTHVDQLIYFMIHWWCFPCFAWQKKRIFPQWTWWNMNGDLSPWWIRRTKMKSWMLKLRTSATNFWSSFHVVFWLISVHPVAGTWRIWMKWLGQIIWCYFVNDTSEQLRQLLRWSDDAPERLAINFHDSYRMGPPRYVNVGLKTMK